MDHVSIRLSSGLDLLYIPSTSPVVYCGYMIRAGARHEPKNYEGLAHFCEHATFKGTHRRSARTILNALEQVGGSLNAFTNKEDTTYYAAVLNRYIDKAVDLLTDIVFHSTYPDKELEKEVAVICDEIESYNDSPAELIYDEFENLIFRNHPLGHNILGQAARVRQYRSPEALAFAARFYTPGNAVFFIHGDVNLTHIVKLLEKRLGDCSDRSSLINKELFAAFSPQTSPFPLPDQCGSDPATGQIIRSHRHTHQAHVLIGNRSYAATAPQRTALYLLNNILGGPGMNSRLNLALRERNGLVYTVDSSMVSYSDTGLWCTYFGCDKDDVEKCRKMVLRELDKMMQSPMKPAQLAAAKQQIKGQIAITYDNRESFALDMVRNFVHHDRNLDIEDFFRRIDSLQAEDLQQAAQDVFRPEQLTTLIYQ